MQQNLTSYVDSLHGLSGRQLGEQLKKATTPQFYVFNPLNWTRSDVADVPYTGPFPASVVDVSTGKETTSQMITKGDRTYLRIWAEGIPSVGYKVFTVRTGQPKTKAVAATVSGTDDAPGRVRSGRVRSGLDRSQTISNAFYRLKLSPSGAITDWVDRRVGNKSLVLPGKALNDLGVKNYQTGTLTVENRGAVSVTLKAVSADPIAHTVRLTLFANSGRIDIEDSINVNFANVRTWSFAFNLTNQTTRHEEIGAVITARKERRAGRRSGGHYAAQNARLDWQTFNHFADLSESHYGVTLSNQDCSFFKLGESKADSLWEDSPVLHALAGGQVDKKVEDGGYMGIFNQNGQKTFRYHFALTSHQSAFNATVAMKFSLEHQNPLVTGWTTGNTSAATNNTFSLLSVDDPNVLLWSVKPAERGPAEAGIEKDRAASGLVTRFWNLSGKPVAPTIRLIKPVRQAWQTSHIETDEQALAPTDGGLKASFTGHQLKTYRLVLASTP